MTLQDAIQWAVEHGYDTAEELHLRSGEKVYLLISDAVIGLPRYLHDMGDGFMLSDDDESRALFSEPAFLEEDDAQDR